MALLLVVSAIIAKIVNIVILLQKSDIKSAIAP